MAPGPERPQWQAEELGLPPEGKVGVEEQGTEEFEIVKQCIQTRRKSPGCELCEQREGTAGGGGGMDMAVTGPREPRVETWGMRGEERKAGEFATCLECVYQSLLTLS